jgi:transcriptional regulator with XRE-family HTH domain
MALWARKQEDKYNRFIRTKVKEAREERGLSQEDLGKSIDKSRVAISDIERGRTEISAVELMPLSYALEKPITYFYPDLPGIRGANLQELSDKERELVHFFRAIQNPALENIALNQIKQFVDASIQADNQLAKCRHELISQELAKVKGQGLEAADEAGRRGEERFEDELKKMNKRE